MNVVPMRRPIPNDLAAFWMPFTANRQFKKAPRLLAGAKDMHYYTDDGRPILDGTAGLWCVNAGHGRPKIVEAVQRQVAELDYAPAFQMSHPKAFEFASRLTQIAPEGLDHVFFTNSGSESVDTALKIALAYHRAKGEGARTRLIGRERGYHGVNFGGISVGGIVANRKMFGTLLAGVDHIRHTHDPARNAFSRGEPEHGAELADEFERIVALHDRLDDRRRHRRAGGGLDRRARAAEGLSQAPARDLRQARHPADLRRGHHRLRSPRHALRGGLLRRRARHHVTAKGVTNGVVPMGAVFVKGEIHDAFMTGPEHLIEFFHGYTYSAHPLACAAGLGDARHLCRRGLLTRGAELAPYWEERAPFAEGRAARRRHPQYRPRRRDRARSRSRASRRSAPSRCSSNASSAAC